MRRGKLYAETHFHTEQMADRNNGSQFVAFLLLAGTSSSTLFAMLGCYVVSCLGGGFVCMPPFVTEVFGSTLMPKVYGFILTAWSFAGVAEPQMVAMLKDYNPVQAGVYSFYGGFGFVLSGLVATFFLDSDRFTESQADVSDCIRIKGNETS